MGCGGGDCGYKAYIGGQTDLLEFLENESELCTKHSEMGRLTPFLKMTFNPKLYELLFYGASAMPGLVRGDIKEALEFAGAAYLLNTTAKNALYQFDMVSEKAKEDLLDSNQYSSILGHNITHFLTKDIPNGVQKIYRKITRTEAQKDICK